ncbi:class I SAM-dependent methyltransferase [Nocardia seriolae]|uniref:Carnitine O-acetyltransferase n=1 Tax=Nocardia seriolae TaxID=37332 RepID=A0A0B8N906_9NOCA|nr:class I SAM-dependent methyltransferase [Nocardia seriolae]APA99181.1 Carnitine O-acetyltransferase [Nocardia seriolae]MTJ63418.1 class I SAM-dependent methyltransferase [Nocardia seriolae]MTJ70182.1 class I SAM-dependent methyltransferase [Nocardia seriolae]MTJ88781.1 class I SAM-dependent methyltransferase [Nocardia seriolae]MTK32760.1 class I SAM-dependent methyltransferase [Nocardia seriolae]
MPVSLHSSTGKASFDDIYERPDPREYYARMAELDYQIPELAKPHIQRLLAEYRSATGIGAPAVLDIGCSYGVNAALLRLDTGMAELAEHYRGGGDTAKLIDRDRELLGGRDRLPGVRFIGMDASRPALDYARAAGFLQDTVHADLESADPTEAQRRVLAGADLAVSTGCVGYISERTLLRVARAHGGKLPWMAHFVLRMFAFEPIAAHLAALGYHTERAPGVYRQRRFASADEQARVLNTLADSGIDTADCESDGWLYAQLYISRPKSGTAAEH